MKLISKIIEIILNVVIAIVTIFVFIGGIYVTQTQILKKEYPDIFGYTAFEVITGSMSKTIEIGDVIIVKISKDFKVGDIVVYKQQSDFITHRVVEINENTVTTKGDANNSKDKKIDKSEVIGVVIKILPKVAIWKKVLSTPIVWITIFITIILFGFAFSYENKGKSENNKTTEEKENVNDKH